MYFSRQRVLGWISAFFFLLAGCGAQRPVETGRTTPTPQVLDTHCRDVVGGPRVERISAHVWAAIGYDLASTALIHTPRGNVIVDTSASPGAARQVRAALEREAPKGPVAAVIYTHSHIDHVGGAAVWASPGVPIWATAALPRHMLKQYALFLPIEAVRGMRQFGKRVPRGLLPCSALGPMPRVNPEEKTGMLLPTHTFSGRKVLDFGGFRIELVEAHGETHDQLFVWVPSDETLIAGDNFYWSFPNLYTLRGTSPRPVADWIRSIDAMRRKDPEHLLPCHTKPIHGKAAIRGALTNYRDAIQWVRDEVVRGANRGLDMDTLAEQIKLPSHLARHHYNQELYGQIDWSVRAIYTNNLGWFDGRPEKLYPLPVKEAAAREVALMGGPQAVLSEARKAAEAGELRWAVHLLTKLRRAGRLADSGKSELEELLAQCYEKIALGVYNTNGRAYLLESAVELRQGPMRRVKAKATERLADSVPLENIFALMAAKLIPERAMDRHESLHFRFPDVDRRFVVTVRRGVAEVAEGDPLPGTPDPVAVLSIDAADYKRMVFDMVGPLKLYAGGKVRCEGSWLKALSFLRLFDTSS